MADGAEDRAVDAPLLATVYSDLRRRWLAEQDCGFAGWDFSYLDGRTATDPLPWDYRAVVDEHLKPSGRLLDMGTGGGEFLLSD